jgi:dihydroorotate dehydrogenase
MNWLGRGVLMVNRIAYERIIRRLLFLASAQRAHANTIRALSWLDRSAALCGLLANVHRLTSDTCEFEVGGVRLPSPFILAAGLVKGEGFETEAEALAAVEQGRNIIPGWRAVPWLVGLVEFGSFTRYPRLGNPGVVVWRDERTRSTQNRVGLRNPGAVAAATFLSRRLQDLPPQFGINVAISPGVTDPEQEETEVCEAVTAFLSRQVYPAWFTLNLSCPNTDDDPGGNQTEDKARRLCGAVLDAIRTADAAIPLWVKVSPELAAEQYAVLMRVFHEVGVRAVIATNTLPRPTPDQPQVSAGVGGGLLREKAVAAARCLSQEKLKHGYAVDVIGCGGVMDANSYQDYRRCGVQVVQYWSALVYRGPLVAALIADELRHGAEVAGRTRAVGN